MARPPDKSNMTPVLKEASFETIQQASDATSSTVPSRFIGILLFMYSSCASAVCKFIGVAITAGASPLTVISVSANSFLNISLHGFLLSTGKFLIFQTDMRRVQGL